MRKNIKQKICLILFALLGLIQVKAQTTPTVQPSLNWQCGSTDALKYNLSQDPNVATRSSQYESALQYKSTSSIATPTPYIIPVVFHIIKDPNIATPIPTYQQILWQLASLNAAFSNSLTSLNGVPSGPQAVNTQIKFCLAKQMQTSTGPVAWPTSSVGVMNYVSTNTLITSNIVITNTTSIATLATLTNYTLNFPPNMYLNIWCVPNITQNSTYSVLDSPSIIGIGTFPWMTWPIDGIVMRNDCIGNSTYINFGMFPPLDKGNILAHEAGHYLGLFHTFETITSSSVATAGSSVVSCYGNTAATSITDGDLIYDTPPTKINGNIGPGPINTCNEAYAPYGASPDENDQLSNFMSYTDDDLMNTLTLKQSQRAYGALDAAWSTIALTAQRFNLITNANLTATGVNNIPSCGPGLLTSVFTSSIVGSSITCSTAAVQFNTPILPNYLSATSYTWNFGDATTSNLANPIHTYTIPPLSFTASLTVASGTAISTTSMVINLPNGTPKIVGQSGTGFKVCKGTEQTVLIQFPAYATNATITDGTNFYTVNNNFFHNANSPTGVYTYPFTFTATSNVSFSMVPANCSTVSTGVATFSVIDCCNNLVTNGDMENGPTGFYSNYTSVTASGNPSINYPSVSGLPSMSVIIGGTGKAFVCDANPPFGCPSNGSSWLNLGQAISGLNPSTQYYVSVKVSQSEDSIFYCGPMKHRIKFYNSSSTLLNKNFVPSTVPYLYSRYGGSGNGAVHVFNFTVTTPPTISSTYSLELYQVDRNSGTAFDFIIDNILVQEMNPPITLTPTLVTICPNSTVQLSAANGCANLSSYSLVWQPQASLSCSTCANPIASPSVTTVYTLVAIPPITTPPSQNIVLTSTVIIPSFTASVITPTPLCYGSSYTLNAIGAPTATWQPNGLVGTSVVITPTANGTYTASAYIGTCLITKTVNVSGVVGDPASITITSTLNPICYTGSVNTITTCLTAAGSNFTWTPGSQTGNTLCITPTITTNYTVTGLTTNSCAASGSIQLVVLSMPATPTIVASSPYGCPTANLTLTAVPSSAYGYTWTPGTFVGNPAVYTPTANQVYIVNTNSLGCSATASISIPYINAPCSCISGCTGTLSGNLSNSPAANTVYCVTSNLSINGTVTFSNSDFRIYPGVTITVFNNAVLNITGSHLYSCDNMWQGIIVQQGGRLNITPSAARTSFIEDAFVAVDYLATAPTYTANNLLLVDNVTFNKNQISIRIADYVTTQSPYPHIIRNSLFTSRTITFSPLSYPNTNTIKLSVSGNSSPLQTPYISNTSYVPTGMKAPFAGAAPDNAIVLNEVGYTVPFGNVWYGIEIGNNTGANNFNCFDNLKQDITATNSNLLLSNNVYQNGVRYGKGSAFGGKAIVANSAAVTLDVKGARNNQIQIISVSTNTAINNRFYEKVACADINGYINVEIKNAQAYSFSNGYNGFTLLNAIGERGFNVVTNRYFNIVMDNNRTYNIKNSMLIGIDNAGQWYAAGTGNYGRFVGNINVINNIVDRHTTTASASEYVNIGFSLSDPFSSATTNFASSVGNFIQGNKFFNVHNGIATSNVAFAAVNIYSNTVTMVNEPSTYGAPIQNGIYSTQHGNSLINQNNIAGPTTYTNEISAIKTSMNSQLSVKCNTTANTYHGLNFNASQAITVVQDNSMQNQKYGISMTNTATIGTQGTSTSPTNNQWLGSWSGNFKTMNYNQFSTAINSKIYATWGGTLDPNGSSTVIATPGFMGVDNYFHLPFVDPNNTILNASSISPSCRLGGGGPPSFAAQSSQSQASNTISTTQKSLLENLVNNTTPTIAGEVKYIDKNRVYRTLDANTSYTTGSMVLSTFYSNALSSCMQKFVAVEKDLVSGSVSAAQSKLAVLTATNTIENNYKAYYNLYIKLKNATFNSADSSVLLNLCNQCPYTDGGIVYQARALYNIMNSSYTKFNDNCNLSFGSRLFDDVVKDEADINVLIKTKLYPNPNSGEFTVELNKQTEGAIEEIMIYDLSGKVLYSINETSSSIKVNAKLIKGSYLVKVRLSNNSVDVHRIIID